MGRRRGKAPAPAVPREWSIAGAARRVVRLRDEVVSTTGHPMFNGVYAASTLAEIRHARDRLLPSGSVSEADVESHYRALFGDSLVLDDEPAITSRIWELVASARTAVMNSPLFIVSPDMHGATVSVAEVVDQSDTDTFTADDIVWPEGFLLLPQPVTVTDRFGTVVIEALSWQVIVDGESRPALRVIRWSRESTAGPVGAKLRPTFLQMVLDMRTVGEPRHLTVEQLHVDGEDSEWEIETADTDRGDRLDDFHWVSDTSEAATLLYMYAFLTLARQQVTETFEADDHPGHSGGPRRAVDSVRVVRLRRHTRSHSGDDDSGHREWSGWWEVSGGPLRYRNRRTGEVTLTWRRSHIRGDLTGPMITSDKVNALLD